MIRPERSSLSREKVSVSNSQWLPAAEPTDTTKLIGTLDVFLAKPIQIILPVLPMSELGLVDVHDVGSGSGTLNKWLYSQVLSLGVGAQSTSITML